MVAIISIVRTIVRRPIILINTIIQIMVDKDLQTIGKMIRKLRLTKGFSQEELGAEANLDRTYVSDIELGTRNFGIKNLIKIARALKVTAVYLLKDI